MKLLYILLTSTSIALISLVYGQVIDTPIVDEVTITTADTLLEIMIHLPFMLLQVQIHSWLKQVKIMPHGEGLMRL
ncbi:MAG: hypothetical protein ACK5MJ_05820 [Alphaproteobacteria bacterium]